VIDEGLNFSDKVRIIKVTSDYDIRGTRTKTEVECGSLSFAEQQKTSQSTLSNVAAGKIPVPNEWLTSQVQLATNSLLASRTELDFTDQGIIAVDKSDANKVVILNSAGVGVSTDGGQTFKSAITADGVVAERLYGNLIKGITFETSSSSGFTMVFQNGEIDFSGPNGAYYGALMSTADRETGKPNGVALINAPGQVLSLNQGASDGLSYAVFQIPSESTASKPVYKLLGHLKSSLKFNVGAGAYITNNGNIQLSANDGAGNQLEVNPSGAAVLGNFTVYNGTKNAASVTRDGVRATPAYEMAESWFGDMGESTTDENCENIVPIDPIFSDIVNTSIKYQVFLQSYSKAHVWIETRNEDEFIVKSDEPNANFSWELKAHRRGYENQRLVDTGKTYEDLEKMEGLTQNGDTNVQSNS